MYLLAMLATAYYLYRLRGHETWWFLAWPGTVVHEASHYLVGKLTNGEPFDFNVAPDASVNGKRQLGSVSFRNITWFNAAPIGFAPVLCVLAAWWLLHVHTGSLLGNGAMIVLASSVLSGCFPSSADIKIATKHASGLIFWITVIVLFFHYKGIV
jgi:hypothetical protein